MSQLEMPLYQQIYDEIKHAIDNGIYVPGDKIPTETELSTKYAVSRITVRRAIEDLSAAGFLATWFGHVCLRTAHAQEAAARWPAPELQ